MTLKSDTKFKENLTCGFKYDMMNLVNFHPTIQKSENLFLMGFFVQNIQGLKNDERNLVNFHASSWKSRNLHFDRHLLSKAYTVLVEKVNVSWHRRVMQSLKKSSLLVPKMTRGIWWSLMRAVASLKIYIFLC